MTITIHLDMYKSQISNITFEPKTKIIGGHAFYGCQLHCNKFYLNIILNQLKPRHLSIAKIFFIYYTGKKPMIGSKAIQFHENNESLTNIYLCIYEICFIFIKEFHFSFYIIISKRSSSQQIKKRYSNLHIKRWRIHFLQYIFRYDPGLFENSRKFPFAFRIYIH
ncbi:hypothetical protein TRFO_11998 [Tritrichomonas foetus]|uniref:Uncharacterized protein n=1 Tax=Tritrichomonas foetus TaxID=1144522 RepID=A0A1J4J4W0_9EUKA|nr:hypothetical protein TRFO_11998 [Tritrichomonas foetus]|eukprot:OHS93183.1 hypothetical protein TRFO_11998 [Tritrichomonas foetus]